jgi:hypothetical protein
VWGRAPSPVQAERSSAVACGHSNSGFAIGAERPQPLSWKGRARVYSCRKSSKENCALAPELSF